MKRKNIEQIKEKPIEERISPVLLIDHLMYSNLMKDLRESIKVSFDILDEIEGPVDDFRNHSEKSYNCIEYCKLDGINIGTLKKTYSEILVKIIREKYKTNLNYEWCSIIEEDIKKLIEESSLARKTIIEHYNLTEDKIKEDSKEKEIYCVNKKIEYCNEELNEQYELKSMIEKNIDEILMKKNRYQNEITEIENRYSQQPVQKKIGTI